MGSFSLTLQVLASVLTIITMWLYGSKDPRAPLVGLASEGVWVGLVVVEGLWGLLPLCVITTVLQTRNLIKWREDD